MVFWIFLLFLAGCGSGDPSSDEKTGSCDVSKASPGETISCSVAGLGFSDDCIVFFGTMPVEVNFDDEEETIEWIIPRTGQGPRDITFQCGDDEPTTIKRGFVVIPPESGGDSPIPPPQDPPVTYNPTPPPQDPPAPGGISPGPEGGNLIPPPQDPPVQDVTDLKISFVTSGSDKTEALHDKKLGLIRVHWKIEGGGALQQAYLYAPFNRRSGDTDCGKTADGRHLAVNPPPSAAEIADDSPNAEKFEAYLTGTACTGDSDCQDYTKQFVGDLGTSVCRINLTELANNGIREGVFYTRMLIDPFKVVLLARSEGGTWDTKVKEFQAPEAEILNPKVEVSQDQPSRIDVAFDFENAFSKPYVKGIGCVTDQVSQQNEGAGHYKGHCQLKIPQTNEVNLRVDGIPGVSYNFNVDSLYYDVFCGKPELTITEGGFYIKPKGDELQTNDDGAGFIELLGGVTRTCTVIDKAKETYETTEIPFVQKMEIKGTGNGSSNGSSSCGKSGPIMIPMLGPLPKEATVSNGKMTVTTRLPRNHQCTDYTFSVTDFDGKKTEEILRLPYTPIFKVLTQSPTDYNITSYDGCGDLYEDWCGKCIDTKGTVTGEITWKGKHIANISVGLVWKSGSAESWQPISDNMVSFNSLDQPDLDDYTWQTGSIKFSKPITDSLLPNETSIQLGFMATAYDGTTITTSGWKWRVGCYSELCYDQEGNDWDFGRDETVCDQIKVTTEKGSEPK